MQSRVAAPEEVSSGAEGRQWWCRCNVQ